MKLWVARHAFAGPPSDDPKIEIARPLLAEGQATAKAMAKCVRDMDDMPSSIFVSPYQRAIDTAFIYGKIWKVPVAVIGDLAPIRPLADGLFSLMGSKEQIGRVMILGHRDNLEPLFDGLTDTDGDGFGKIVMGEIRRLTIDRKSGDWSLKWAIRPSDLGLVDHNQ